MFKTTLGCALVEIRPASVHPLIALLAASLACLFAGASCADVGSLRSIVHDGGTGGAGEKDSAVSSPIPATDAAPVDASSEGIPQDVGQPDIVDAAAASTGSAYLTVSADTQVTGRVTLLSAPLLLGASDSVLVHSDGRYYPSGASVTASVHAEIDGVVVTNHAVIDWRASNNPQQHSFNVIGAATLGPGDHTVALVAEAIAGTFYVGAGSNLSVMVHPARDVVASSLASDSTEFAFTTNGVTPGTPAPHTPLLTYATTFQNEDTVALASARAYYGSGYGDAMLGLYLDGANPGNAASSWTVNDIWTGAETQAPLSCHAFFRSLDGAHTLSFDASEFPWGQQGEDTVKYKVGAGARAVFLRGDMVVRGSASQSSVVDNTIDYVGIGTSQNWPGVPSVGTDVRLVDAFFDVPVGHSGVIFFAAKTRVQGDSSDVGGTARLWIAIDGARVGATGVQQLASPDSISQRTVSASYLSAGAGALPPGKHHVEVFGRADGSFIHLAMNKDLPLIWFD